MAVREVREGYTNKLKNKLYGLLCEYEKGGEWKAYLDTIIIELNGISVEQQTINYQVISPKVNMLRYLNYEYFRRTIFDCMNLLSKDEDRGIL